MIKLSLLLRSVYGTAVPSWAQGIINLANDAMRVLIIVSSGVAVAIGAYYIVKWYTADDNEKAPAMKKVKQVVFGAVGVVVFEGVLKWVLSYFVS